MDEQKKDLMDQIKEETEDVKVPERLQPDQILKMLESQEEDRRTKRSRRKKNWIFRGATVAAACLVAVAGFGIYLNHTTREDTVALNGGSVEDADVSKIRISKDKNVKVAEDYEDAYAYIESYSKRMQSDLYSTAEYARDSGKRSDSQENEIATLDSGAASEAATAKATDVSGSGYSETNVRQDGVDEGDTVKTDGTYLYVLKDSSKEIAIVDANASSMKKLQTIRPEDIDNIREFYLDTKKHYVIAVCEQQTGSDKEINAYSYWTSMNTVMITYDISNLENPKELGRVTQNGDYESSRKVGDYVYLFSDYSICLDGIKKSKPETYVPLVNGKTVGASDIFLPTVSEGYEYSVVTSIDIKKPGETCDSKAIMSDGGQLYVSDRNIYYYDTVWDYVNGQKTTLRRIGYKNGKLSAGAQGKVDGYINDSYSIDEYKGYLRIVLTDDNKNDVRILDMDLKEVSSIENLAKNETVYSARLMGDTGYFVTFEQVDPLFSVDLSDPKNPEIIGKLKIPGFSDYLHPYGDGKLLGIGMDADEETGVTNGVKITMFDISDPSNVKEEDTYTLENVYSTDVSYDYKAALVDADQNLIGFAGSTEGMQKYFLFRYDEKNGFDLVLEEEVNGSQMMGTRGVYIDDALYVVQGNVIEAYSLKDYQKLGNLIL